MSEPPRSESEFASVADIEVDAVLPTPQGFRLSGQGADGSEYRVDLRFDLALDARSRRVLGEMLTQCEVAVFRRRGAPNLLRRATLRPPPA